MEGDFLKNKNAPDILTGKDLDYLKDLFNWNYILFKNTYDSINFIENKNIMNFFINTNKFFEKNMNVILNILENGENNE